jgi:hypothetical protein
MSVPKKDVIVGKDAVYILRAGIPVFVKTADICSAAGKTNQWIGQLTSQGVINKKTTPHGSMYDFGDTMRTYCAMLDGRAEGKTDETEAKLNKKKLKAETEIKESKAIVGRYEAQEIEGKMHRSEDVAAMTEDLIYSIRSALISLPGRLAVNIASVSDPAVAAEMIRSEVYKIMNELASYRYDAAKYEERVRERNKLEAIEHKDDDEDQ